MSSFRTHRPVAARVLRRAIACSAVVLLGACGTDDVTAPVDVNEGASVDFAAVKTPWVTRVTGGGSAHFPTGVIQSIHAHATEWADGNVTGQFSAHGRIPDGQNQLPFDLDWEFDVEIDCLAVSGGQAWMGGIVTRVKKLDVPGPFPLGLGSTMIFVTRDRHADPALPPGFFGPAGAFGTADCRDMPAAPPLPPGAVINGGFTIHQK